jgi:hypothetical protein
MKEVSDLVSLAGTYAEDGALFTAASKLEEAAYLLRQTGLDRNAALGIPSPEHPVTVAKRELLACASTLQSAMDDHIYNDQHGEEPGPDCGYAKAVRDAGAAAKALRGTAYRPGLINAAKCGLGYVERFAELNGEPADGDCRAVIRALTAALDDPVALPGAHEIIQDLIGAVGELDQEVDQLAKLSRHQDEDGATAEARRDAGEAQEAARKWLAATPEAPDVSPTKVAIVIEGGTIQELWSERPIPVEIIVFDQDIGDVGRGGLHMLQDDDGDWVKVLIQNFDLDMEQARPMPTTADAEDEQFDGEFEDEGDQ